MTNSLTRRGRAKTRIALQAFLFLVYLSGVAVLLPAQNLTILEHRSIAPISIPIGETGATGIGITRFQVRNGGSLEGDTTISSMTLSLTDGGTFVESEITDIRVYYEDESAAGVEGEYDNGSGINDIEIDTGGIHTFSGGTAVIPINPLQNSFQWGGGGAYFYVVFDFTSSAATTTDVGCEITSVTYGASGVGTPSTASPTAHNSRENVDNYRVTPAAAGTAAAQAAANENNVDVFRLDLSLADTSTTAYFKSVKVHRPTGVGADNWVAGNGVLLYADDGDDDFEPGTGDGTAVATGTLGAVTAGYATLTVSSSIAVPAVGKSFFVAVNMNSVNAVVGQNFSLEVENPSTDITFVDEIEDDNSLVPAAYAFVTYSVGGLYEYDQQAYVNPSSTATIPSSGNTFTIEPADDATAPSVVTTVPDTGATGFDRNANLTVIFSEWMTEATVIDTANFELTDGITPVTVGLSYDAPTQTLTVNPSTTLDWGTLYTATVKAAVEDFYNNAMGTDYSWTFTVEPAVYPTVQITVPADAEINVVRDIQVKATFSENVSGVNGTSFTLYRGATQITGLVAYDGGSTTATFTPSTTLDYSTQYTATVTTAVNDDDGLNLQTNKVWNFWTLSATPPAVLSVFPANGTTDVPISSTVQAVFSKPIDQATLTGNFTVEDSQGTPISGTISYVDPTATFTPAAPFGYLKTYTATITTGVTDSEGTALSAQKIWDFTTFGFDKATIVNNRIVSGGNSETLIFVPVPPSTSDKVSVQVFTTTGRLVRSFYRNATYSSIESQLPIRWDGTNDRGRPLGPGLYFVQIVVAGNKQTLKVMIVR